MSSPAFLLDSRAFAVIARELEIFPRSVRERAIHYATSDLIQRRQVNRSGVQAVVHGTKVYATSWRWTDAFGEWWPTCTCPVGPSCKHAFALGILILALGEDLVRGAAVSQAVAESVADSPTRAAQRWGAPSTTEGRAGATRQVAPAPFVPASPASVAQPPAPRARRADTSPETSARRAEAERAARTRELTTWLSAWSAQRTVPPSHSLRVVLGLQLGYGGAAMVTLQVRVTNQRVHDEPRGELALRQLLSQSHGNPRLLSVDHAGLLAALCSPEIARALLYSAAPGPMSNGAVVRLLLAAREGDAVRWGEGLAGELGVRGGIVPGGVPRLGAGIVRLEPVVREGDGGPVVEIAYVWPEGTVRVKDDTVLLRTSALVYGESAPELLLADGAIWHTAGDIPADVADRLTETGPVSLAGEPGQPLLRALAAAFPACRATIASRTRVRAATPVAALVLDDDDSVTMRVFAPTSPEWVPGAPVAPGEAVFEYGADGTWLTPALGARARVGEGPVEILSAEVQTTLDTGMPTPAPPHPSAAAGEAPGETPNETPGEGTGEARGETPDAAPGETPDAAPSDAALPVWLELPDDRPLTPLIEWMKDSAGFVEVVATPATASVTPAANAARRLPRRVRGVTAGHWQDLRAGRSTASVVPEPDAPRIWRTRLSAKAGERFAAAWDARPAGVRWYATPRLKRLLEGARAVPRLRVHASGIDWLTVTADWAAEGFDLNDADLALLRRARTPFVKLRGGWVRRDLASARDEAAATLAALGVEAGAGEQRLSRWQLVLAGEAGLDALTQAGADPETLASIELLRISIRDFRGIPRITLPATLTATLRPYQQDGVDFLVYMSQIGMGVVLADDMGLGKTVQTLAWIAWLREHEPDGGPSLVIAPASVIRNWERESAQFTPDLKVLVLESGVERHLRRADVAQYDLVITTYALLRLDLPHLRKVTWRAAILDEAQMAKNPDSDTSRAARELDARYRVALTGTPLENRVLDLWSIMAFVNPGYLGTRAAFERQFAGLAAPPAARALLSARLRPVMMRRLKSQVAADLPPRIEERRDCEMTPGQRTFYLAELAQSRRELRSVDDSKAAWNRQRISILAVLMRLRQICCHPALAGGKDSLGSGKFDALMELLEPLMAEGHKVLVFSQFVECLKRVEVLLTRAGYAQYKLTGQTKNRQGVVDAFSEDPGACCFLISLRAGGTGLNLTAARYVVLLDPWWNPAVEAQAIDRTHRIGQDGTVIAYRLLSKGSIEERMWELQQRKAAMVRDVLGDEAMAKALTRDDLEYLLGEGE